MLETKQHSDAPIRILLIDDDEDDYILTRDILAEIEHIYYSLDWEMKYDNAFDRIIMQEHDIYLIDYRLGESDGISLISKAIQHGISSPLILLTGKGDHRIDMKAMEEGAADYLVKGNFSPQLIERSIRYALNHSKAIRLVKEGENKFRQLFERSIDSIYISSTDHNLIDVNPSLLKLLGYSRDEIIDHHMSTIFQDQSDFENFQQMLETDGQIKDFETILLTKQNNPIDCQLTSIIRTDHAGNAVGYQGIIHDISLRKKAEHELLIAERLSMTGKIARSIAHEVRNPLSNVGLALDQMEDEIDKDNEDVQMFIDIIKRNANRIGQLITEMLNSSKPKELNRVASNLNDVVNDSVDLVRDRLTLKGMKLQKNLDPNINAISLDEDKIKMAFLNVLVNAIEAMEEDKGILTVETRCNGDEVELRIHDNGSGIKEEDLNNLFDPFYTNKQGGMGLGLTSTQNIIHSHGGSIMVKSYIGKGTTFLFTIPVKPVPVNQN